MALHALARSAAAVPKKRKPTRPTRASKERRLEGETRRGPIQALREKITD